MPAIHTAHCRFSLRIPAERRTYVACIDRIKQSCLIRANCGYLLFIRGDYAELDFHIRHQNRMAERGYARAIDPPSRIPEFPIVSPQFNLFVTLFLSLSLFLSSAATWEAAHPVVYAHDKSLSCP